MLVLEGSSCDPSGRAAVAEATADWSHTPDILFAFCSATQDASEVVEALTERFPGVPVAGCTTSGEHLSGAHFRHAVVVSGLCESQVGWATRQVRGLADFDGAAAEAVVGELFTELGVDPADVDADEFFALLFIDGLSMSEERISALLDGALNGVPLAGGSAGDDLAFAKTEVLHADGATNDAFTLVLGRKQGASVHILKHQHFRRTPASLVITKADPASRRVYEMDGYPALTAYAAALGKTPEEVTGEVTFLHPVTFSYQGEIYVRSIQAVHDDGSISFYCGIEEGMVLEIGGHDEMASSLQADLGALHERMGQIDFLLGFNCILRALEAEPDGGHDRLGAVVRDHCGSMVGFDTYGEQLQGLHINQTLVAVAFAA
jgi:hypothetical protein